MTQDPGSQRPYDPYQPPPGGQTPQQPGYPHQPGYGYPQPDYGYGQYPGYGYQAAYGYTTPGPPPTGQNGLAIAGMVLGIVSIPLVCCWIGWLSGIVGAVLSGVGLSKANSGEAGGKGMALAGLILSIIAIALTALLFLVPVLNALLIGNATTTY